MTTQKLYFNLMSKNQTGFLPYDFLLGRRLLLRRGCFFLCPMEFFSSVTTSRDMSGPSIGYDIETFSYKLNPNLQLLVCLQLLKILINTTKTCWRWSKLNGYDCIANIPQKYFFLSCNGLLCSLMRWLKCWGLLFLLQNALRRSLSQKPGKFQNLQ